MARPRRIVLVRHGESTGNVDDTVYEREPDHALALTDRGRAQAEETGKRLREVFGRDRISVYVSPYRRTRQTLRAFRLDPDLVRIREEPRLREQDCVGHPETAVSVSVTKFSPMPKPKISIGPRIPPT
ncbi:hypothetical protein SVIOM342S_00744 [Streptomyces violaceorubidus]